jgi:ubiquitin C-terminal hydrolase
MSDPLPSAASSTSINAGLYVTLRIPAPGNNTYIESCQIGEDEECNPHALVDLLRAIPANYTAKVRRRKVQEGGLPYALDISCMTNTNQRLPVFTLLFQGDLKQFRFQMRHPQLIDYITDEHCRSVKPSESDGPYPYVLHFFPSRGYRDNATHPFTVLRSLIKSKHLDDISQAVRDFMFRSLAAEVTANLLDQEAREDLGDVLSRITGGSVNVEYMGGPPGKAEQFGTKGSLFRLTCVFPWAIDILLKRPNCLMTDSTFKVLAPYTLPILHAIFANESIPIAFGISPTETSESYDSIYEHIATLYNQFLESSAPRASGQDAPHADADAHPADADADQADGMGRWPDDTATDGDEQLTGEFVAPQWEDDVPEIDQPIGQGVPAPVKGHARSAGHALLRSFPLLTDQGTALEAFITSPKWDLTWKICHRHIIEAIGAKGPLGSWATRLLCCYSKKEWEHTRQVIILEMALQRGQYSTVVPGYESVLRLLGLVKDKHHLADMDRWALWCRLGCPRTTNSAESVNGHLNQSVRLDAFFTDRIKQVAQHFMKRYSSRNTWCDRALTRNAHSCFPSDAMKQLPWFCPERAEFYRALHNATELDHPVRRQFPPPNPGCIFRPHFHESIWDKCPPLPLSWLTSTDTQSQRQDAKTIPLHQHGCENRKAFFAWQIAHSLRKELGQRVWVISSTQIFTNIVSIGTQMGVPDDGPSSTTQEATWRSRCRTQAFKLSGLTRPINLPEGEAGQDPSDPLPPESPRKINLQEGEAGQDPSDPLSPECRVHTAESAFPEAEARQLLNHEFVPRKPHPKKTKCKQFPNQVRQTKSSVASVPKPLGFKNFGLDCFRNAVLQCLLNVPRMNSFLADSPVQSELRSREQGMPITAAYSQLLASIGFLTSGPKPSRVTLDPAPVLQAVDPQHEHFPSTRQHDAHEFLLSLLDGMHDEFTPPKRTDASDQPAPPPFPNIIKDLFYGSLHHSWTCEAGNHDNCLDELSPVISLPLPADDRPGPGQTQILTLAECLEFFLTESQADQNDVIHCDLCGGYGRAVEKWEIRALPPFLVFHLSRFTEHADENGKKSYTKNEIYVECPEELDMSGHVEGQPPRSGQYALKSVVHHDGEMESGHYVAYVKRGCVWFCCNDRSITSTTFKKAMDARVYILFYERLDM